MEQGNDLCLSASHPLLCPLPLYSPWAFCCAGNDSLPEYTYPLEVVAVGLGLPRPLFSHTAYRLVSSMLSEPLKLIRQITVYRIPGDYPSFWFVCDQP